MNKLKKFFYKDKSGRGYTGIFDYEQMMSFYDECDWDNNSLYEYIKEAEIGDTWEDYKSKYTRIV